METHLCCKYLDVIFLNANPSHTLIQKINPTLIKISRGLCWLEKVILVLLNKICEFFKN